MYSKTAFDSLGCLQDAVTAREAEITRLWKEAGRSRDVDAMALQHRCQGQESLILQLTEQVLTLAVICPLQASNPSKHVNASWCCARATVYIIGNI